MIGERHCADRTHVDCADGTDHGGADTPGQRSFSRHRMMAPRWSRDKLSVTSRGRQGQGSSGPQADRPAQPGCAPEADCAVFDPDEVGSTTSSCWSLYRLAVTPRLVLDGDARWLPRWEPGWSRGLAIGSGEQFVHRGSGQVGIALFDVVPDMAQIGSVHEGGGSKLAAERRSYPPDGACQDSEQGWWHVAYRCGSTVC